MFESFAEIIDHPAPAGIRRSRVKRTGEPVRRHSRAAGRERLFWRPITPKEADRIVLAAQKYELASKAAGRRNGALGGVGLEVLRYLANRVDWRTGRLEPSIDTMMQKLRRSRDAIVTALKALRAHGFLDWLRRYVATGNEGRGPQVQQTSNAYRLFLPPAAARLIARYFQPAPIPDDFDHAQKERATEQAAQIAAHRASLTLPELALFAIEDEELAAKFASWGANIAAAAQRKERESAKRTESLSGFLSKGE